MPAPRPLKIGITCYPSVGGSGILATALGEELARRGHQVHFISYERPFRLPDNVEGLSFHPVVINDYGLFKYPDYTLPLSVKMAEVSRSVGLDILHVHYAVPHATAAILAQAMLPEGQRPRLVTTLHGTDTTLLGRDPGYGPAVRHALDRSDAVTSVSHFLERETRRVMGVERPIDVIHNFFVPRPTARSREEVRRELGLQGHTVLFHASNLRPLKRIDRLLDVVSQLKARKAIKLLILAGADFSPYRQDVVRLGLEDQVVVREHVSSIEDYVQAADIGLFTSETESFCLSLLEAMAFGCPSVSTRVGGIPEVVESGVSGILCDPGSDEALVAGLDHLIAEPAIRRAMGQAALARATTAFCADAIVPSYERLYRRVLSERA